MTPQVGIVMGSDSDLPTMEKAGGVLERFGVDYEIEVMSAHRASVWRIARGFRGGTMRRFPPSAERTRVC